MEVTEKIIKQFEVKKSVLSDVSKVRCNRANEYTSLSFLKIMQRGSTWYEKYGYSPRSEYPYSQIIADLRNLPLSEIIKEMRRSYTAIEDKAFSNSSYFEYINSFEDSVGIAEIQINNFAQISKPQTAAHFFSWLWEKDCAAYIKIKNLAFPLYPISFDEIKDPPSWWPSYSLFLKSLNDRIKVVQPVQKCSMCGF